MPIRRTYQINTQGSSKGDGLLLNQSADVHGLRTAGGYPFALDISFDDRAEIGDYPAYKTGSLSLPARIVGGLEGRTRIINANDSATTDDLNILVDTSGGDITLSLPSIATVKGKIYFIKNIGGNWLYIARNGSDTIDGDTTSQLNQNGNIILFADTTNNIWRVNSRATRGQVIARSISVNPSVTTTSNSFSDVATGTSFYFSGRPCMFFVQGNCADVNGSNEYNQTEFAFRFDNGGSDILLCRHVSNLAVTHDPFSGFRIWTPAAGSHIVTFRWRRTAGAGTITMDFNDMFDLNCIELN